MNSENQKPDSQSEHVETVERQPRQNILQRLGGWIPRETSELLTLPDLPTPIVSGLIQPATVSIIAGEGASGKTTLLTRMAMSIATGTPFLGLECNVPGTSVIFLAEDDQQRADYILTSMLLAEREQMVREGWAQSAIADFTECVRTRVRLISVRGLSVSLTTPVASGTFRVSPLVGSLCRVMEGIPDLRTVIWDTLSRFAGVSLESNDLAAIAIASYEQIAERTGAHVMGTHHTGKEAARFKAEDQYSARGASSITDNARLFMRLRRLEKGEVAKAGLHVSNERHEAAYLRLSAPKGNYLQSAEPMQPLLVRRQGFLFRLANEQAVSSDEFYREGLRELARIICVLKERGSRSSKAAIEDHKAALPRKTIRAITDHCIAEGWLQWQGKGPTSEIVLTDAGREIVIAEESPKRVA